MTRPTPPRLPSPTQPSIRSPFSDRRPDGLDPLEQERLRVEYFDLDPRDTDPRHVEEDDLWDPVAAAWIHRPSGLIALLTGLVLGIVIGFILAISVVHAAPRSGQTTERLDVSPPSSAAQIGAPRLGAGEPSSAAEPIDSSRSGGGAPTPAPAADLKHGPSPAPVTEPPAIAAGLASYCAPTPTHCQGWGGDAHLGAVPSFRYGDRPFRVTVCRQDDPSRCTVVRVVSFCGCGNKIIDLSPSAFDDLAPLSRGVVAVTVTGGGPGPTPPATDIDP